LSEAGGERSFIRGGNMEKDWVLSHIALHVKDLDEIAAYYESIGIGIHLPIKPGPPPPPDARVPETLNLRFHKAVGPAVGATPKDAATFLTFSQIGTLNVECTKNPGADVGFIHHVCFNVPDLYAESVPLVLEKGCDVPFVFIKDSLIEENHIDTGKVGSVILSLRPDPEGKRSERERAAREALPLNGWQFLGLGIAVEDLDKVVAHYEYLGIGSFSPEKRFDDRTVSDLKMDGSAPDSGIQARSRRLQIGPMIYEFTQPLEGESIYRASLKQRGEGVNDFIFAVEDLEAETAKLSDKGVKALLGGNPRDGGAFAYFDTRKAGGMMMRLIQA